MRYLILLLPGLFFLGCEPKLKLEHPEIENLRYESQIKKWERENGEWVENFFLDYHFGMTAGQFQTASRRALDDGRLRLNENNEYAYEFSMRSESYIFVLVPLYTSNRLSGLVLISKFDIVDNLVTLPGVSIPYLLKYGHPNVEFEGTDEEPPYFKYYRANLLIHGRQLPNRDIHIKYEDWVRVEEEAQAERKEHETQQQTKFQSTISDI